MTHPPIPADPSAVDAPTTSRTMDDADVETHFVAAENPRFGYSFRHAPGDRVIGEWMALGLYEPAESELWTSLIRPDSVVLDIGACIGHYTMVAAARVDAARGKVFAFEPQPDTFALLRDNVAMNPFPHVVVLQRAVGASPGTTRVYRGPENWGGHQVYSAAADDGRSSAEVEVITIDHFLREAGVSPTVIKMDVEGYEFHALRGMEELLASDQPLALLMEFFPAIAEGARRATGDGGVAKLWSIIRAHFTEIFRVDDANWTALPVDYATALDRCRSGGLINLLCRREAGWRAHLPADAGTEAFAPEFSDPLHYRLPSDPSEVRIGDVILRLIELGHGHTAVPVVERAIGALEGRGADAAGVALPDLAAWLRAGEHAEVAGWVEQAVEDVRRCGGALTDCYAGD